MSLEPGKKLAHYDIVEPIGKGGMGEVYRAKDAKLGRDVAIKVLPDEFAESEDRLARFQREATVLASLNHPNIAGIYGLEEHEALRFLVLELVPGETLDERLRQGPIPYAEALELAGQIADALAAAHDSGVIHRDLKPANVKITPDGQVKVLDFGLAKALTEEPGDGKLSDSPTLSAHATKIGMILGTAAYMSPEQARGKPVDKRTDIFSFGAVLYEMLTGRQLFKGEDAADTMASVIRSEPDFHSLPTEITPRARELLARCLEKDPKKRKRDIGDVRAELVAPGEAVSAETPERRPNRWLLVGGAVALALSAGTIGWHLKPDAPRRVQRFEMVLPEGQAFRGTSRHVVAVSPRGTHLVYVADNRLHLRALDQIDVVPVSGTEFAREPFFSPDGAWIGFYSEGFLKKVALTGGTPVTLCEAPNLSGASWGDDDTIVFGQGDGVWEVSANGGEPRVVAEADGVWSPQKLPGGDAILFTLGDFNETANWDGASIVVERLGDGGRTVLVQGGTDGRYLPTGHLVYAVGSTLFAVPFDVGDLEVTGGPIPVVDGVMRANTSGAAQFSFSRHGTLAFASGLGEQEQSLIWIDRRGEASPVTDRKGSFSQPRVSPDGGRIAVTVAESGGRDVWILDVERDTLTQLTTGGSSSSPAWSPDGEWLVVSSGTSNGNLFRIRSDFSGPPEPVLEREGRDVHTRWMPDGSGLVFQNNTGNAADLWTLSWEGENEPRLFLQTPGNEAQPDVSPDGRFVAYHSTVSGGTSQIFVQPFTDVGGRRQISTDGGWNPRWSPAGNELFYLDTDRQAIMAVDVETEPRLEVGVPRLVFDWPIGGGFTQNWDVSPDGQRFVVLGDADTEPETRPRINFVLNWFDELERLVPVD